MKRPSAAEQVAMVAAWNAEQPERAEILARGEPAHTRGPARLLGISAVVPIVTRSDGFPRLELLTHVQGSQPPIGA